MGGEEFCILTCIERSKTAALVQLAAAALSEAGDTFQIGCSYGTALMPSLGGVRGCRRAAPR
jgi:hypothetical protein